jgi:transposase
MPIINRSIGSRRSMPAKASTWIARRWPDGWAQPANCWLRWLTLFAIMHVLASKLHADDTPVPVLAPGNGKTKTGRLWTYVRDDRPSGDTTAPAVWFAYSEDRKGEHPRQHLKSFKGAFRPTPMPGSIISTARNDLEVACWAHARRKFHEIHIHPSPTTTEAIERDRRTLRDRSRDPWQHCRRSGRRHPSGQGKTPARQHAHLDGEVHTREALPEVRHRGRDPLRALALACPHPLRRTTGSLEIDNNAAERALRVVALGRKNYLVRGIKRGRRSRRRHLLPARISPMPNSA